MTETRLSLSRVREAQQLIDPVFLKSPQFEAEALSAAVGVRLTLKLETLNPVRSFKGRGADFLVSTLKGETPVPHLVCASAGNFGQAVAWSARKHGLPLTIYAAESANPLKVARMKALGAEVRLQGQDFDAAKLAAKAFAEASGARMLEDSLNPETAEGAGTMGLELLELSRMPEVLLVPLGNGAMISGIALAVKARRPEVQIIAVQAEGAPAMTQSWRSGRVVTHERVDTVADGIAVRLPVPEALDDMRGRVDDALLISDSAMIEGMKLLHQHVGVVAEPSGAVGLAGVLEHRQRFAGKHVGTVVCGGNLTVEQMKRWLS